jgi:hypothetical protein
LQAYFGIQKQNQQLMKSLNIFRSAIKAIALVMVLGSTIFLASCKDDNTTPPAPTLSLNPTTASGLPGTQVTTTVSVDAPAGGKTLNILINGAASQDLPAVTLDGSAAQDVTVNYTIPANAAIGTTINVSFQAVDNSDQQSSVTTLAVTVSAKPQIQVTADITTDTHWTADNVYVLTKLINVGTDTKDVAGNGNAPTIKATATLTIDAGTVILGKRGTPGGGLIVHRGSKLIAVGTSTKPIVFTSAQAAGTRVAGDWSGLVICGKGINNIKASVSTGQDGIEELEGSYGGFHGNGANSDANDNSGTYQYVRVEFAGYPINPNQEINGVTFGSVGAGTTFDHVQVSYSNDDSFEWFGGSVKPKYLVAYKGIDDDFDTDNGFSGQVQFGLGLRDANYADQSGSNGFECDNDAGGSSNTPITNATFSNMTIIGGKMAKNTTINLQFQNTAQIRRNAQQDIINSYFSGYPNGIFIDNALGTPGASANAASGALVIKNNVIAGVEGWGGNGFGSIANTDEQTILGVAAGANHANNPRGMLAFSGAGGFTNGVFTPNGAEVQLNAMSAANFLFAGATPLNKALAKWTDVGLGISPTIYDAISATPVLLPTGTTLLTGADFTGYTGFTAVTFKGAFGAEDWTNGWVNWNPQSTDYSK